MSICEFCGAEGMDHDYQHLARECYPLMINAKQAEIEILAVANAHLRLALAEIDAVAVGKKAGAAKRMQAIARKALSHSNGDRKCP